MRKVRSGRKDSSQDFMDFGRRAKKQDSFCPFSIIPGSQTPNRCLD